VTACEVPSADWSADAALAAAEMLLAESAELRLLKKELRARQTIAESSFACGRGKGFAAVAGAAYLLG
jgi:hypothetical protein